MNEKKNVLFVGSFPPQFGGISSHLSATVPDLINEGYKVTSLSPAAFNSTEYDGNFLNIHLKLRIFFLKNFLPVIWFAIKSFHRKANLSLSDYLYAICLAKKIEILFKSQNFDHIFFYTWKNGFAIPYLESIIQEKSKLHMFMFGGFYEQPQKYLKLKPNIKMICDSCHSLFASSQYCADSLEKIIGLDNQVQVIYVGVDVNLYKPTSSGALVRKRFGIPSDAVLVVFFGRMNAEMGLDVILDIVIDILKAHSEVYFLIAGAKNDLSDRANKLAQANTRIKYWENVPQSKKPEVFASADILLSPTKDLHACMGVSIKEAMASGKPVIGSSSGGIPEAISEADQTGFIANIHDGHVDSNELIRKLSLLVEDTKLREVIGGNARLKAEKIFSTKGVLEKYKKVFRDLN